MSGFSNGGGERKIYASIIKGNFALKAPGPDAVDEHGTKATKRLDKNGKEVFEFVYEKLSGVLEKVEVKKDDKYGWQFLVYVRIVAGPLVCINVSADSKYGDALATRIQNFKINEEIGINPFDFTNKEGKKQVGISFSQNGEKIPAVITKDTPNGRPAPSSDKMDEDEWKAYMIIVRKFYRGVVTTWIEKNCKPVDAPAAQATPSAGSFAEVRQNAIDNQPSQEDTDDLPF
jgi:hypothetical protein